MPFRDAFFFAIHMIYPLLPKWLFCIMILKDKYVFSFVDFGEE